MPELPNPTEMPEIDEELTAYLDGELGADAAHQVEQRLATDAAYRHRLSQLERAWNLLDRLDQVTVGESFTRTTLEMVAVAAAEEAQTVREKLPVRRRLYGLLALASLAGAMLMGYFAMHWFLPRPNEALLADLPILQRLEMLKQAESLEFLRALHSKGLFGRRDAQAKASPAVAWSEETIDQRRARVAEMSPTQRELLRYDQQDFAQQGVDKQQELRELYRELTMPVNRHLQPVLHEYFQWFDALTPDRQAELLRQTPTERVARIQRLKPPLSDDDLAAIVRWIEEFAVPRKDSLLARRSGDYRGWFNDAPKEAQRLILASALVFSRRQWGPEAPDPDLEAAMVESFAQHVTKLSQPARDAFANAKDPQAQREVMLAWTHLALREHFKRLVAGSAVSPWLQSQTESYGRSLSSERAARLRGLPEERRARELRRMYFSWRFSYFDGEPPREGRGPSGFRPPRPDERPNRSQP